MSIFVNRLSVVEPDPLWPQQYEEQLPKIRDAFGGILVALEHVGGTSVPHLAASQRLDILALISAMEHLEPLVERLLAHQFEEVYNHLPLRCRLFGRAAPHTPLLLYVMEQGDPQALKMVRFRDFLRKERKVVAFLSRAKKNLTDLYQGNIHDFLTHKTALMQAIDIKALSIKSEPAASKHLELPSLKIKPPTDHLLHQWALDHFTFFLHWSWLFTQKNHPLRNASGSWDLPAKEKEAPQKPSSIICGSIWAAKAHEGQASVLIEQLLTPFEQQQIPASWWVTPRDTPEDLFRRIHKEGVTYQETASLLFCDLSSSKDSFSDLWEQEDLQGDQIVRLHQASQMVDYCSLLCSENVAICARGRTPSCTTLQSRDPTASAQLLSWFSSLAPASYAPPSPLEFYLLYRNNRPTACCSCVYYAGHVGFYNWSYLEQEAQALLRLVKALMQRAAHGGWRHFLLLSSEESAQLFLPIGFSPLHPIHRHLYQPASQS